MEREERLQDMIIIMIMGMAMGGGIKHLKPKPHEKWKEGNTGWDWEEGDPILVEAVPFCQCSKRWHYEKVERKSFGVCVWVCLFFLLYK